MKMVKSLLLGSAAGMVAVTAGQAADLPVKAKPVEYVKVCSLYGAGFYYMPGTDLCIKVGGFVRFEAGWGNNGNFTTGPWGANAQQRQTSNTVFRARGYITADVRNQSEYGTVHGYIAVGLSTNDLGLNTAGNQFSANRAFLQWGGFTAGIAQSFYDFYSTPATSYWGAFPSSDTGDPGWLVAGYTMQLGNGFSASLSEEARRTTQIIDQNGIGLGNSGSITPGGYFDSFTGTAGGVASSVSGGGSLFPGVGAYGGQQLGDVVANVRLDQAWGSAQVMGALHEVNATYYSSGTPAGTALGPTVLSGAHPSDAWGWAAGAGLKLNMPMIGQGDFFQAQVNATQGALRYVFFSENYNYGQTDGASSTFGVMSDAVYGGSPNAANTTSLQLTSAWGFNAAYEHYWVPNLHTSAYGGYDKVTYGAQANAMLCSGSAGATGGAGFGTAATATAGCNNDWSMWFVGSRTQWDVTKTFYLGVDVLYQQMHSGSLPAGLASLGSYSVGSSNTIESSAHEWMIRFRAHRDFLP
jgi:hypothetical protein